MAVNNSDDNAPTVTQLVKLFNQNTNVFTHKLETLVATEWARQEGWRWIGFELSRPLDEVAVKLPDSGFLP